MKYVYNIMPHIWSDGHEGTVRWVANEVGEVLCVQILHEVTGTWDKANVAAWTDVNQSIQDNWDPNDPEMGTWTDELPNWTP